MRRAAVGVFVVALVTVLAEPALALRLIRVGTGFTNPVHIASNERDPGRTVFVVEQGGRVWRLQNGSSTLFLDLSGSVSTGSEQGLLSVAFDPDYATNRFLYINYTNTRGDTRVVRFRANPTFSRAVLSSRRRLLAVNQPFSNHNGGQLAFSRSGRLYVGMGDGGSGCDPGNRAQNLSSRLGKLLSIDPRDLDQGWRLDGYGLRNPWRFSFDRQTGRLYLADVGQDQSEELDTRWRTRLNGSPENYGWNVYEGKTTSGCATTGLTRRGPLVRPINVYGHSAGRCSVTGGFVYRGAALPNRLGGWYFFGDFCSGEIWRLLFRDGAVVEGRQLVRDTGFNISSFGEDRRGEIYVADRSGGEIYRIARS